MESPAWDALTFRLVGRSPEDFSTLKAWFACWFDEHDRNDKNEEGFFGVVHFLSDPERTEGAITLRADLGTAPMAAFDQLLTVLVSLRPTRIEIT